MSFFIAFQEKSNGLNAARHKGTAKIGLDCSGRLLPDFLFDGNGNVVPSLNPDAKARKRKKRLSDSCQDECKPCDEKPIILQKTISKARKKTKKTTNKVVEKRQEPVKKIVKIVSNDQENTKEIITAKPEKLIINDETNNFEKKYKISLTNFLEIYNNSSNRLFNYDIYNSIATNPIDNNAIDWNDFYIDFVTECYNRKLSIKNKTSLDPKTYNFDSSRLNLRNPILLKKSGFESFKNIVSRDEFRPAMQGVFCEKDMYVGTDAHKMITIKSNIDVKNIGKILNINSKTVPYKSFIDSKFPDYKRLFDNLKFKNENSINILDLIKEVQNFVNIAKILAQMPIYRLLPISGNYEFNFNSFFLLDTLLCLEANGNKFINLICTDYNKVCIETDNGNRALLMATNTDAYGQNENIIVKNANPKKIIEIKQGLNAPDTNAGRNQFGLFGDIEIFTEEFKKMKVSQLRAFAKYYYKTYLQGSKIKIRKYIDKIDFFGDVSGKLHTPMYSSKAAVLPYIEDLLENSTYNNWGNRKPNDSTEIMGYLNMKSKLLIDGEKKHVNISISVNSKFEKKLKSYSVGKKEEKTGNIKRASMIKPLDGIIKPVSNCKDNKNNTKKPNSELNIIHEAKIIEPEKKDNRITLANKFKNRSTVNEFFKIYCNQLARFIGQIEIKPTFSVVITLTGDEGSGKTRMCFQMMNAFAQNNKVGHASMEEQPDSNLYLSKQNDYLNQTAIENIESPEINSLNDLHNMILRNDVIVIDSYTKMKEIHQGFEVDKDLRKKYNGKLFIVIFQQTTTGAMRGGSKSQFDADVVIFTQKFEDNYKKNYIYCTKNRYNKEIGLQYNIFNRALQGVTTVVQPQKFIENAPQILLEAPKQLLKFKVDQL